MTKSDKRTRRKSKRSTKTRRTSRTSRRMNYVIADFDAQAYDPLGGAYSRSLSRDRVHQLMQFFQKCGWESSFLERKFAKATDSMLRDYTSAQWVEGLTQQWLLQSGYKSTIANTFISIGFQRSVANHLDTLLSPFIDSSYDEEQIILKGIVYVLGKYKELAPDIEFLHNSDIVQEPYTLGRIQGINVRMVCNPASYTRLNNVLPAFPLAPGHRRFYHVTNWDSAEKIQRRIQHGKGRDHTDFGANPAFYLSPSLVDPLEWGEKNGVFWKNEIAILLFHVPYIADIRWKDLKDDEWSSVVRYARNPDMDDDAPELEGYDVVYGPMLSNTTQVRNGGIPRTHFPIKYQLASKSDAGDRFLQSCMIACIYFNKHVSRA